MRPHLAIMVGLIVFALGLSAQAMTPAEATKMEAAVSLLCPLIEQEAALVAEIQAASKNPAGVVDLRQLHAWGELLRFTRVQIREGRRDNREGLALFAQWYGKPLDLGFCIAWNNDHS